MNKTKRLILENISTIKETDITSERVYDLEVEVNHSFVANGYAVHNSVCTTKLETGFSRPQFSAVMKCSDVANVPVIADGGIVHNGDIAKALVAGATMIMAGSLFAGHDESPGDVVTYVDETGNVMGKGKSFFGSASEHNKGEKKHVEGKRTLIRLKGPLSETIRHIQESLRSSVSYAGGSDLSAFATVDWIAQKST